MPKLPVPEILEHYPFVKRWRKLQPLTEHPRFRDVLERDFNKYTVSALDEPFPRDGYPGDFDSMAWYFDHLDFGARTRPAAYWGIVCSRACHRLVNPYLELAQLAEPSRPWRILTSREHSTVWDGAATIFDPTRAAMRISARTTFLDANGRELQPGSRCRVGYSHGGLGGRETDHEMLTRIARTMAPAPAAPPGPPPPREMAPSLFATQERAA